MALGDVSETKFRYYVRVPKESSVGFETEQEITIDECPAYKAYITAPLTGAQAAEVKDAVFIKLR